MDMAVYLAEKRKRDREEKEAREARRDKILIPVFIFLFVLTFYLVWWFK